MNDTEQLQHTHQYKKVEINQEPRIQPILESRILTSALKPPSDKQVKIDQSLYISEVEKRCIHCYKIKCS
jgi:hypothetical protein